MEVAQTTGANREGRPQLAGLFARFEKHPVAAAVLIVLADMALVILVTLAAQRLIPAAQPDFIALCVATVVVAAALTLLGWWRTAGFNRPAAWRSLYLLWLPAVVTIVLPLLIGARAIEPATAAYLVFAYVLVGLREEALYRGIILRVLRPAGALRAVILSAALFGVAHSANLLVRSNPLIVLAQMVGAFCFGLAYAALRLRTNTIWFLVALHALHDLLLRFSLFPLIPLDVVQDVILLLYAIYLLRDRRALEPAQSSR
ncbi:MAG: CPBP family intramembrane metalloprotease [Kouleothrix sp.]|nr:CPBP family intramembrane metalloprotease [Kouleothrix sp.]